MAALCFLTGLWYAVFVVGVYHQTNGELINLNSNSSVQPEITFTSTTSETDWTATDWTATDWTATSSRDITTTGSLYTTGSVEQASSKSTASNATISPSSPTTSTSPITTPSISTTASSSAPETVTSASPGSKTSTAVISTERPSSSTSSITTQSSRSSKTTTTAPTGKLVQMTFYGSAANWMTPKIIHCVICTQSAGRVSKCLPVTDIRKTTNLTNDTGSSYTWRLSRSSSGRCERISFYWMAKWLFGDQWGYLHNGKLIHRFEKEMVGDREVLRKFLPAKHPCDGGALHIVTEWQEEGPPNITCGEAFYTTTESPYANITAGPHGKITYTVPKFTGTLTPPKNAVIPSDTRFGEGSIIAIAVCSVAVVVLIILGTFCSIRSFNKKRRRFLRDVNFNDYDEPSIAFDNITHSMEIDGFTADSHNPLYTSLKEEVDDGEDQTPKGQSFLFTGDVEDIHHRSGGGVSTITYDAVLMSALQTNNNNYMRKSQVTVQHTPLTGTSDLT